MGTTILHFTNKLIATKALVNMEDTSLQDPIIAGRALCEIVVLIQIFLNL